MRETRGFVWQLGVIVSIAAIGMALACAVPSVSHATSISFAGGPTNLLTSTTTIGGIGISAYYWNGSTYLNTPSGGVNAGGPGINGVSLYMKNGGPTEEGLGVCSPAEQATSACSPPYTNGGGNINELDNLGAAELIRLELPAGYLWVSAAVSSLDTQEAGRVYWSNQANPDLVIDISSAFSAFSSPTNPNPFTINLSSIGGFDPSAKYLYFQPGHGPTTDNDFLVSAATIGPVPEPSTLLLLASGLVGLGAARKRYRRK